MVNEQAQALDLIWGVDAIAKEIGRSPRQTYHMVTKGELPAKQIGSRWVIERNKLMNFFLGDAA